MASYPTWTIADLSGFSGRPASDYLNVAYIPTAIAQATLLFKLGTCLSQYPDDPIYSELAKNAILAMSEAIYNVQGFQKVLNNPFSSETIGSYSYSKVAGAVANGLPTGVSWFDLAVGSMGVCDLDIAYGGGIEVSIQQVEYVPGLVEGNMRALLPSDFDNLRTWGQDPAPIANYGVPTSSEGGSFSSNADLDGGSF